MATLQPILEEDWERHKDVLKDMYCAKKLPLQSRKGKENEPGVIELMKGTHGFVASPSQYELQFKKWGFAKNLKSGEWAALISQYDLLCQTKSDVRITISGAILSKNKIDRARRRYRPRRSGAHGDLCEDGNLPTSRQAYVEYLDDAGEWRKYSSVLIKDSNALILHKSSHAGRLAPLLNDQVDHQDRLDAHEMDIDPWIVHGEEVEEVRDLIPSLGSSTAYRPFSPPFHLGEILTNPMHCFGSPNFAHTHNFSIDDGFLSSLPSGSSIFNGPLGFPSFLEPPTDPPTQKSITHHDDHKEIVLGRDRSAPRTKSHLEDARHVINSLVQYSEMAQCSKSHTPTETGLPNVEDILESLESLLPETGITSREAPEPTLSVRSASSSSTIFKTLLYSFTNNFAGLHDVPKEALMQVLRDHHDILTQLFEIVKTGPPALVKPLADNMFRAAVEGCDADAVATIIHHTKGNPKIAIDPNEIVCNLNGQDYTPIELAAKFRNTELVRTLVACIADPNKTYKKDRMHLKREQGALALALGHWLNGSQFPYNPSPAGEPEPVNLDLLRLLLDCGADVHEDLVLNAMRPGPENAAIAEELISRIQASDHRIFFKKKWLAISTIHYLENRAACRIIKRFFALCLESDDCGTCVAENPRLIERMLCHAVRRTNLEVSELLVQHTAQLQSPLAAAVRAACDELIQLFLNKGAHVDDPIESWEENGRYISWHTDMYDENGYDRPRDGMEYVITPIRTPLAEAIRARNDDLINAFERLGALTCLTEKHHFHAAVFASAEVGNTSYLEMLLGHVSRLPKTPDLTSALAVAIRNDETEAALILLDAGAKPYSNGRMYGSPLVSALQRCNKRVVDSMLESDLNLLDQMHESWHMPLESAATWCTLDAIEDFISLGAHIDVGTEMTPLEVAVKSRNKTLVCKLLDLGANPEVGISNRKEKTPLRAALETGDHDMVRFLISRGATPADSSALVYAMEYDTIGYKLLLSEFKSHYPHGLPGFGGRLLVKAIELESHTLFDSLLNARADVNGWCQTGPPYPNERNKVLGFAIQHQKGRHDELVRRLLERGAEIDCIVSMYRTCTGYEPTSIYETPLLLAINMKNQKMASLLLDHRADLNRPARRGVRRTPLQAACETGSYRMVEFLLQRGARVNEPAARRYGVTALQMAAQTGSLRIAKLLLDNGADPYMAKSKVEGRTAFEAAAESGCIDMLLLLWNAVHPLGFSEKECQNAQDLARRQGHRGCVDFIDFLSGGSSPSMVVDDLDISNFL